MLCVKAGFKSRITDYCTFSGFELSAIGSRFSMLGWLLRPRYVKRSWLTLEKR